MRIIKMYMLQMSAFKVHVTTIIKRAGVKEARARARHSVKHPTKVTSFHAHNSPDFYPCLTEEETEAPDC